MIDRYFKINFENGLYILHDDYLEEFKEFLKERQTAIPYLAKHYTIQEISDFLRTKTTEGNARNES